MVSLFIAVVFLTLSTQSVAQNPWGNYVICPVLGSLINEGSLTVDSAGNIQLAQLKEAMLRRLNISPARTAVTLGTGFIGNHWDDTLRVASGTFSIKNLRGSFLDHSGKGDTGILFGGEFHQDRFNFLLSHSTDGRSLSINDLADAVRDNLRRDRVPLSPRSISEDVFEAAALINTFGTTARGQLSISFETLLNLYKYRTLPQARLLFQRPATGVIGHVDTMRKMLTRMGLRDIRIAAAPTPNAASDVSRDSTFTAATPVFCPNSVPRSYTDSGCKINGAAFSCSPAGPFALMSRDNFAVVQQRAQWASTGRSGSGCCVSNNRVLCATTMTSVEIQ